MRSGLVSTQIDSVIDFVKTLDEEEKRSIRTSTMTGLMSKAAKNGKGFEFYLRARDYLISTKGSDSGNGVSLEFVTKEDKKQVAVINVDSKETFINGMKANSKDMLDRGSVVDFMMGVMPSFLTKKKNENTLYEPSSNCPKDFKIQNSALGGLFTVLDKADENVLKNVRLDIQKGTEYHEVLVKSAPPIIAGKIEAVKNKNNVPILKTHVMKEMAIKDEKTAMNLMKNVDKVQHPKGGIRNFCEERSAYGVPLTKGQMRVICAINDHVIPEGIKALHLYTKDTVYAYAFRNKYPNIEISMLGDRNGSIDKAKFKTMTISAMKRADKTDTMRINFDMKSPAHKELSNAFVEGSERDEEEASLDKLYETFSRYKSVYCMSEGEEAKVTYYTAQGFVVVGSHVEGFNRCGMLSKYINMKIYKYLYPYIWTPMVNRFEIPRLQGRYQSKLSAEDEKAFTRYFDTGCVSDYLDNIEKGDSPKNKESVVSPLIKRKKNNAEEEEDDDMMNSLAVGDDEEDSEDRKSVV